MNKDQSIGVIILVGRCRHTLVRVAHLHVPTSCPTDHRVLGRGSGAGDIGLDWVNNGDEINLNC